MRAIGAGFGLVAVLVTVAIMLHLWSSYTSVVSSKGQDARAKASQIAGYDPDSGIPAKDTITLTPFSVGGKLKHVVVTNLVAGGAFEKYYGLKRGDLILGTEEMEFRRENDPELAIAMIQDAYQKKRHLTVMRDGEQIVLPDRDR